MNTQWWPPKNPLLSAVGGDNSGSASNHDYAGVGPYAYSEVDQTKPYMQVYNTKKLISHHWRKNSDGEYFAVYL